MFAKITIYIPFIHMLKDASAQMDRDRSNVQDFN